jgi:hypothetical protein
MLVKLGKQRDRGRSDQRHKRALARDRSVRYILSTETEESRPLCSHLEHQRLNRHLVKELYLHASQEVLVDGAWKNDS